MARSSITAIVGELLEDGTLVELESRVENPGYRGRPRVLLGCNPQARRVLAIWIDESRARIVVADAAGNLSSEGQTPTGSRSPRSVIDSIIEISRQLVSDSTGGPVAAAGVCIPGLVDGPTGVVIESAALGWSKTELGGPISRALGIPTAVQDATQAITLAEAIAGQAREVRSAIVLDCGAHFGIGLIIDGRPYVGGTGIAGSIGHVPAHGSDAQCHCGRTGCIDASMSLPVATSLVQGTAVLPVDDVIDRIAHTAILVEALIDPEVLILGGLIVNFDDLIGMLETRIDDIRPPERRGRTMTMRSQIGRMNAPDKPGAEYFPVAIIVALQQLDPDIAGLMRNS